MEIHGFGAEERQLQFTVDANAFRNAISLRVRRGLAFGWTNIIGNGFHKVWHHCSLTMKRNYLSSNSKLTTTPYWTGNAVCRTDQCIAVKFIVQDEPDAEAATVTVKAHITGSCRHADSAEGSINVCHNLPKTEVALNGRSGTMSGVHSVVNEYPATESSSVDNNDDSSHNESFNVYSANNCSFRTTEDEDECKMRLPQSVYSAHYFECKTKHSQLEIKVLKADVTKLTSDGIVNAANGHLRHAGGVARAISVAAGPELQLECFQYIEKHGEIKTTNVMHTCGGRLHCQFVIHAVGPVYDDSKGQQHCKELLEKTFLNVFKYANDKLRLTSLAVPAISAGIYGFPPDVVSASTYDALLAFDIYLKSLPADQRWLKSIAFVNIDDIITKSLITTFKHFFVELSVDKLTSSIAPRIIFKRSEATEEDTECYQTSNDDDAGSDDDVNCDVHANSSDDANLKYDANSNVFAKPKDNTNYNRDAYSKDEVKSDIYTNSSDEAKLDDGVNYTYDVNSDVDANSIDDANQDDGDASTMQLHNKFSFKLSYEEYNEIAPKNNNCRLVQPWTDIFYKKFHRFRPECALVFTYNHCTKRNSRKHGHFWWGRASCRVDRRRCIKVWFTIVNKPISRSDVDVTVTVHGSCTHATAEDIQNLNPELPNRRFLRGADRFAVASELQQTVETPAGLYEQRLSEMGVDDLKSGNTTHCQNKEIYRQVLYETEKNQRIHDNIFIEIDMLREAWEASLPGGKGLSGIRSKVTEYECRHTSVV